MDGNYTDKKMDHEEHNLEGICKQIKEYVEKNPALIIFSLTAVMTILMIGIKFFCYLYRMGYNMYFNIPYEYIEIPKNIFYEVGITLVVTMFYGVNNLISIEFMKKRRLIKFIVIEIIILLIFFIISDVLENTITLRLSQYMEHFIPNIINHLILSFLITILLTQLAICSYFIEELGIKACRMKELIKCNQLKKKNINIKIEKCTSKRWIKFLKKRRYFISRKIKSVKFKLRILEKNNNNKKKEEKYKISFDFKMLIRIMNKKNLYTFLIALVISSFVFIYGGYLEAVSKQEVKIIPKEYITLQTDIDKGISQSINEKEYDFAALYENENTYLVCPCKEEGNKIRLLTSIQTEIDKKDVLVIYKRYKGLVT